MTKNIEHKIYELFNDEDFLKEYSNIIASYQPIENNQDLKREAKDKYKRNAKQLIGKLQRKKKEKAEEIIEKAKEEAAFSFPDPPGAKNTEEELLNEIKKSNQLSLIKGEIHSTDNVKELIDIAREYEENPLVGKEVDRLVKAKFKREGHNGAIKQLDMERQPTRQSIEQNKNLVNFLTSSNNIVNVNKAENGDYEFNWRDIEKDLKNGDTPNDYGMYKSEIDNIIKGGE